MYYVAGTKKLHGSSEQDLVFAPCATNHLDGLELIKIGPRDPIADFRSPAHGAELDATDKRT